MRWPDYSSWEQYGVKHDFDKRNLKSLYASENKEERSWYYKGSGQKWLLKFPFSYSYKKEKRSLEQFIHQTPEAQDIALLATVTGNIADIADILTQAYPERFISAADLARSLPGAVKRIGHSLQPFTFEKAGELKGRVRGFPSHVQYNLDELLYTILVDQYQISFNKKPKNTLEKIRQFSKDENIGSLASRVLEYYDSIYTFNIPGFGKIKNHI